MRAAVLGSPIAHSLSPVLHRAAWAALGLEGSYDAVDVVPSALPLFLDGLDGLDGLDADWVGLSLTMPLKRTVLPLLDDRDDLVAVTGAANTVVLRDGRRSGHNTDVDGIVQALAEGGVTACSEATVLGAGATAASALAALAQLGAHQVQVLTRSGADELLRVAGDLGLRLVVEGLDARPCAVVVNTTPAGALDDLAPRLAGPGTLLDVVYDPWPTALAQAFSGAGAMVVPGTVMLLHQAVAQVELMTGRRPPVEAMRAVLP